MSSKEEGRAAMDGLKDHTMEGADKKLRLRWDTRSLVKFFSLLFLTSSFVLGIDFAISYYLTFFPGCFLYIGEGKRWWRRSVSTDCTFFSCAAFCFWKFVSSFYIVLFFLCAFSALGNATSVVRRVMCCATAPGRPMGTLAAAVDSVSRLHSSALASLLMDLDPRQQSLPRKQPVRCFRVIFSNKDKD